MKKVPLGLPSKTFKKRDFWFKLLFDHNAENSLAARGPHIPLAAKRFQRTEVEVFAELFSKSDTD